MCLKRKALIKWSIITVVCGGHSFFWGYTQTHNIAAMLLGMATLILMFSLIESHPRYQSRRASKPIMAKALDWGIKIRLALAVYIPVSLFLTSSIVDKTWPILTFPYIAELWIGMAAIALCDAFLSINIMKNTTQVDTGAAITAIDQFIGTYFTTITTGLIHTVLLSVLCILVWVVLKLRSRIRNPQPK